MKLIKAFAIAAAASAFAAGAQAQNGPAYDWTGFYVGLHGGYGWGESHVDTAPWMNGVQLVAPAHNTFSVDGPLGGVQMGYNHQFGRWVLGVEGDFSYAGIDGSFNYDPATGPFKTAGGNVRWMATFRGRVGHAFDRFLVYGTGGLSLMRIGGFVNNFWSNINPADRAKTNTTEFGWTAGAGVEYAITDYLSVKGEYLYLKPRAFSSPMLSPGFPSGAWLQTESHAHLHTFRIGLNLKFR